MKLNTLKMLAKKDWSPLLQSVALPLALIVGVVSFVLVADGKSKQPKPPPAKKIARTIHIHVMPVKPKRRFRHRDRPVCRAIGAVMPGPYGAVYCPFDVTVAFGKRTVSVYSAGPSPSRFPQARQKRISRGIGAPH